MAITTRQKNGTKSIPGHQQAPDPGKGPDPTAPADQSGRFGQNIPLQYAQPIPVDIAGTRQTEPARWTPYTAGGLGIIARRAVVDPLFGTTSEQLQQFAGTQPMRLLSLLPDIHPGIGLALWNALRLTCPIDGFEIAAVKKGVGDADQIPDKDMTQALRDMWDNQPPEIGGLAGFQTQLTIQALFTGLACCECVPDSALKGIYRAWPVDSLTVSFGRIGRNDDVQPYQRQVHPQYSPNGVGPGQSPGISSAMAASFSVALYGAQYIPLSRDRFFWSAIDPQVDDPYGRAPYATALSEVLADLALMQDLRDAVHNSAWPRTEVGVDLAALHKVAVEVYRISDPKKATEWVSARFAEIVKYVGSLGPGDNIVHDSSGNVKTLQPGGFNGMEGVLTFLRNRLVMAVKTLPTLMGISEGATNFNSVEWTIYAEGLETLRAFIAEIILDVCNLHLRLIGSSSRAIARYEKIRTNDSLVEANTKSVEILNATNLEKLGYMSHDEACMTITGREAFSDAQPGVIEPLAEPMAGPLTSPAAGGSNGSTVKGTRKMGKSGTEKKVPQNPNTSGTTKEERDAKKQTKKANADYVVKGGYNGRWYSDAA